MQGTLYIVATPIGNLQDITFRAIEILKNSDYILAESSARTSKLLNEYNCILQEYYERTGEYPANDFNAWLIAQRITPGRKNPK